MSWPRGRAVGRKCHSKGRPPLARPKAGYVLGPWAAVPVPVPFPAPVPAPVPVPVRVGLESQHVFAPSFSSTAAPSWRKLSRSAARARLEVLEIGDGLAARAPSPPRDSLEGETFARLVARGAERDQETCSAVGDPSPLSSPPSRPCPGTGPAPAPVPGPAADTGSGPCPPVSSPVPRTRPAPGSPVPMPGPAPVPGSASSAGSGPCPPVSPPVPGTRPAPGPAMARQSRPDPALFARPPSPTDDLASLVPPPPVGEGAAPLPFGAVARELVRSRCAECRLRTCDCPDDVAAAPSHPWARRRSVLARPESRCGRNHLYCLCADRACGTRWHLLIGDGSLDGIQWPDEVGRP